MLAYSLCEVLGWPHPKYLLPLLTPSDLAGWSAYFRIKNQEIKGEGPKPKTYATPDQASEAMRVYGAAVKRQARVHKA